MKMTTAKTLVFSGLLLIILSAFGSATAQTTPDTPQAPKPLVGQPSPIAVLVGSEVFQTGGRDFVRYRYQIENFNQYATALFAPSPKLPPCGSNNNSSRTWVDFYTMQGKRLYGFCALASPADLGKLWFALAADVIPPSWIYIEFTDRLTNTKYKSNLVDTTL